MHKLTIATNAILMNTGTNTKHLKQQSEQCFRRRQRIRVKNVTPSLKHPTH